MPSRKKRRSRSQVNMSAEDPFSGMPQENPELIPDGLPGEHRAVNVIYHTVSAEVRKELEAQARTRLMAERQRIRAEMKSYQLPEMKTGGYEEPGQLDDMKTAYEDEFKKQVQTPEFMKAAKEKTEGIYSKMDAQLRNKKLKKGAKAAGKKAQEAADKAKKVGQAGQAAGKLGWDAENAISLLDTAEPADLEIPTIFTVMVQMYRACTALFNNGEKIIKGFLGFLEPTPLFRFWHPKDIQRAIDESIDDPLLGGGTELENTIESFCLGWPEAIIGWFVVGVSILLIAGAAIFLFVVVMLAIATIGAIL